MTENSIQTEKLNKNYGVVRAVNNLYFQVHNREIFLSLEPNGAGKRCP